ncbi:DUF5672 family protein [Persicitalea jodogahamensis]|uniref:DUF5672 domain-containing protein n=1 Tax=Persicitalea jodogahamensis TaxID=402147 RepID=A0A8J3D2F4_9BACT|nr:DUF5672 family protein [Persicitalea jodogahamensis]GHB69667.1 hypothetical protein GCM10007390_24090 [Persicitalea jodogahamensis]
MNLFPEPSVAVLIPIYQTTLSETELASLTQGISVLGRYPVLLVKPEGLDVSAILQKFPSLGTESFADHYFTGTDSYNQLLISLDFYRRFAKYQHILIYQLDAWVFRDELPYWCAQKYDYLGAPGLHQPEFDSLPAEAASQFAEVLTNHRLVFNGGLSLRRVKAMIRYLKIYQTFYPAWKGNEDMLFSLEATRLLPMKPFIKLPSWQEALRFSFEKSPAASYELTGHQLPFGCHAGERYAPEFWRNFY